MNEIIEGNKLIAEFMGWIHSVKDHHGIDIFHYPEGDKLPIHCKNESLQGFKYHSSWDWLKPVIDQCIRTVGVKTIDECSDEEWKVSTNITRMYIGVPIEWAWNYVVEFIKWHNKNNNHGNNI